MIASRKTVPRDPKSHGAEEKISFQLYALKRMPAPYNTFAVMAHTNMAIDRPSADWRDQFL